MHPFYDYLCEHLADLLKKRSVVVFYDPRREFLPFFDREPALEDSDVLPRVTLCGCKPFLARFDGTFFGLRNAVEPIVAADKPEPLILYLPGIARDRAGSVLMELELGGTCYEPQLKRLALNVLRQRFTDGQIDEMLRPASVTYDDIVSFLEQGLAGKVASVLHTLFGGVQGEQLIILGDASSDAGAGGGGDAASVMKPGNPSCGDGAVSAGEQCDGSQLDGQSCQDLGFDGGSLGCTDACRFDTSGCTGKPAACGDSSRWSMRRPSSLRNAAP